MLNQQDEIRNSLLSREIISYNGHNKLTQKELVSKIENLFQETDEQNLKKEIVEKILILKLDNSNEKTKEKNNKINESLRTITRYYNELLNKNLKVTEEAITADLNYGIFFNFILNDLFLYIEKMKKELIIEKIKIIPNIIKFAWDYQFNDYLKLSIDPKKYRIFVNQNYELKKIEEIYLNDDFDDDLGKELFNISIRPPINEDFKSKTLNSDFNIVLEKYKNNFHSFKLNDICKNTIESKIIEYFHYNSNTNLMNEKHKDFREVFFALHKLIKRYPFLKYKFPQFKREKGNISLKFVETKERDMDKIVDQVENIVMGNNKY